MKGVTFVFLSILFVLGYAKTPIGGIVDGITGAIKPQGNYFVTTLVFFSVIGVALLAIMHVINWVCDRIGYVPKRSKKKIK